MGRGQVQGSGERSERRSDRRQAPERHGSPPSRARGDAPGGSANGDRAPQEPRRRRPAEQRFAGWGDGLARVFCESAVQTLPTRFPPEQHGNLATIPRAVVAGRPGELLLCTHAHCGPHIWPDGEVVDVDGPEVDLTRESD